jgi:ATP-dependent protease ClpP protease subunit
MPNKFLKVLAAKDNSPAEILVHGPIGKSFWSNEGISGKEFTDALNEIPVGQKVNVGVNSQGGAVNEGLAIYNAIKRRAGDVTVRIDGYALSIASVFPLAAGKVISPKSSIWMIHNAWLMSDGNAKQLRKDADMLDKHDKTLVGIYADKTGKKEKEIAAAMEEETWMSGEEAQSWGLADEMDDTDTENAKAALDFSPLNERKAFAFKNCKAALAGFKISPRGETPSDKGDETETKERNKMNRSKIIAALTALTVAFKDEASDEQLLELLIANSKPQPKPAPKKEEPAPKKDDDDGDEEGKVLDIAALRKQVAAERRSRITSEVTKLAENRIENDDLSWWVALAVKDEAGTYAAIKKLPVNKPGGDALGNAGNSRVAIIADTPLERIRNEHKTPQARLSALKSDWTALMADAEARDRRAGREVLAANTYSATLVTSFLSEGVIVPLQNKWAALKAFGLQFEMDRTKPLASVVIKNPTAGSTTQTDATNFESGNSTVGALSATMHQYTQSFQVSNSDLQNGLQMENLVTVNVAAFANKITEVFSAPITAANFPTSIQTIAPGAFGFSDSATLQGLLKKAPIKNLVLDGEYIAQLANSPGFFQSTGTVGGPTSAWKAFGWDLVALLTDWTGAGANIRGIAMSPQAIAAVLGLPLNPPNIPGGILSMNTQAIPDLDISIAMFQWFNPASRTMWWSYDIMGGVTLADATAGFIIKSS